MSPKDEAEILLIDTKRENRNIVIAKTHSWNVQQGCMAQWLGPDYTNQIIFNDYRNGKYCSVILTLDLKEDAIQIISERIIQAPIYSVSSDGKFALTLDFSRLHRLRPGYGYYNKLEETADEKLPNKTCIWKIDLISGTVTPLMRYTDFAAFEARKEMAGAEHKVNHIMLSPSGKRFMVLHRWYRGEKKYSRLVTCNVDGTDMYNLCDNDMVSHCCWKDDKQILAFANKKYGYNGGRAGNGYYLMEDRTQKYKRLWENIDYDGHPSYSPDRKWIVFDTYPNRARVAALMVSHADNRDDFGVRIIAKVFAPFKYDNDTRCDLHPRWNHKSNQICFDSVYEGHRGLYTVDINEK